MLRCMACMEEYQEGATRCPHCGHPTKAAQPEGSELSEGTILAGRYIVGRTIGTGGFGITYLGYDAALRRKVAIKEYFPTEFANRPQGTAHLSAFTGDAAGYYKRGLASFLDEARRLATFSNQGSIVAVHDSFEANDTAYIVMEYLDGKTLKELLKERGRLSYDEALGIMTPILDALSAVHSAGIIHRDVAPDNILIRKDGSVVLIDFGAARTFAAGVDRSMTVVLKPGYAPAEQYITKGRQGPWTDVYATAATFYRMLTGQAPQDSMQRALSDELIAPSQMGVKLSQYVEAALLAALTVEPEIRTQSVAALRAGLMGNAPTRQGASPSTSAASQAYEARLAEERRLREKAEAQRRKAEAAAQKRKDEERLQGEQQEILEQAARRKRNTNRVAIVSAILVAVVAISAIAVSMDNAAREAEQRAAVAQAEEERRVEEAERQAAAEQAEAERQAAAEQASANPSAGDVVSFGDYSWRVLAVEDGQALLITEDLIGLRRFDDDSNDWATSEIRAWLNGEFLSGFTPNEQQQIAETR
ncbi:MAG: protein kinase, partial [Coriobacteriales bacterium]|nr:protein kinase [Coriobacteriales bacterium]